MRPWAAVLALSLLLRAAGGQVPTLPGIRDKTFIRECVQVHNDFRSSVQPPASNMRYMVVWDHSYKIGCAVTYCKEVAGIPDAANFVCNYSPRGNLQRQPYLEGRPCSNCEKGDTCENKLCNYPSWYPSWEYSTVCDRACIAVIVLRALLLLLTPVAVYCIQKLCTCLRVPT